MGLWRGRSLHHRLTFTGAVAILIALLVSAAGLAVLFDRHVERVAVADLRARLMAIAAMVETEDGVRPVLRPVTIDPLYDRPFSGHYWQVDLNGETMRSRSLWDSSLAWPEAPPPMGETRRIALSGPQGEALLALEIMLSVGAENVPLRVLTATDREEIVAARRGFLGDLVPFMALFGLLLVLGSWLQVRTGLGPLKDVSTRIMALRGTPDARIGTALPTEILPLAQEIDQLLDARDRDLARARHRAADLAHGFKTPLQALFGDAAELRDRGETEVAESVERVATAMRTLVDRELLRARIQSDRIAATADTADVARRVVDVLRRTPTGKRIAWTVVADTCHARIETEDLTEALGAVLENACRFAAAAVDVAIARQDADVVITVTDDGPGIGSTDLAAVARRGVRLDQTSDGDGIGLALASEIVAAADGELRLRNTESGLHVTLRLRAA